MMKKTLLLITALILNSGIFAQIYMAKNCEITFFSRTPVEDITAINKDAKPLLNTTTNDIQVKIAIIGFVFEKPLMQEHFNENYMDSEKFPYAFFKGKINEKIDYTKDGEYKATATGKMTIHGVEKDITMPGVVTVKGEQITISSNFKIKFADYDIVIPRLQRGIIPEDTEVKINAILEPFKKK